jgi:hypothetical protein
VRSEGWQAKSRKGKQSKGMRKGGRIVKTRRRECGKIHESEIIGRKGKEESKMTRRYKRQDEKP